MESPRTHATNDNFPIWTAIGLQAALILNRLRTQQEIRDRTKDDHRTEEQSSDDKQRERVTDDAA